MQINKFINNNVLLLRLFDDPELLDKVPKAFLALGGALAALQFIGILLLNEKPQPKKVEEIVKIVF